MTTHNWTGTEFRARLEYLGLTLHSFSRFTGRDLRTLRRVSSGISENVSKTLITQVQALERQAENVLAAWDASAESGTPIVIPTLDGEQKKGVLPARWYLALAGRHIAKWGTNTQIEWED